MKSAINLESPQQAPQVLPNAAVQSGTNRTDGARFNAILKNHMRLANTDVAPDKEVNGDVGQGLTAAPTLMNLAPAFVAQQQSAGAKPLFPAQDGAAKASSGGDLTADPALAMWIAALAATQMQANLAPTLNGAGKQITGAGVTDLSLVPPNALILPKLIAPATGIDVPVLKTAPAPPDIHAELNAKDLQTAADAPAVDLASFIAHLTSAQKLPADKVSGATDKNKADRQDIDANPALGSGKADLIPPAIQSQGSDSKSQPQTSSEPRQNHSGNESRKNTASAEALQSLAGQSQSSGGAATSQIGQASLNVAAQASGHSAPATEVQTNTISSDVSLPSSLRDSGGVAVIDSAPRIVSSAKLMEAAGQAEMRVSVKSETGTVDVRAMLEGNHISATVAAQHSGTRDWLVANLHELHSTFSRDDLNLRTFEVTDTALQNERRETQSGQQEHPQNSGAPAHFRKETHSPTGVLSDLEVSENTSQALSLHA